jgi:hypothetical protein
LPKRQFGQNERSDPTFSDRGAAAVCNELLAVNAVPGTELLITAITEMLSLLRWIVVRHGERTQPVSLGAMETGK